MNQQDIADAMGRPISRELLGSSIPARVAYVGVDGDPRVVPIGFHWNGSHIVMCTVPKSAKVRALQQNPRVAMVRITVEPDWAKLLDFETTLPQAVEDLVRTYQAR